MLSYRREVIVRNLSILLLATLAFAGCAVTDTGNTGPAIDRNAKWVMLPILNHTEVPQAGQRAEAITEGLVRAHGVSDLTRYPAVLNVDTLFEPSERKIMIEAEKWARIQKAKYAIYGAVDEWRYKVGIDGEPAVGVALFIMDLETNQVVWTGVGGKSGWSREALSAVAQKLIKQLLATAPVR
jgi:polysaccharide biosynthesis protein PelC